MKKRSKQNNPEQKTGNLEFMGKNDVISKAKAKFKNSGGQPVKSEFHQEADQ